MHPRRLAALVILALAFVLPALRALEVPTTEEAKKKLSPREIAILRRQMKDREDQASAAFKNAETAFLVGEYDKAIEEFLAVSREYNDTSFRMRAVLRVGDVYYRQKKYERAVSYYQRALKVPSELWWPEDSIEEYARSDYMIGVCSFDQKAMDQAFAHFRRFVKKYPDSRFVDRAYDFIGRGNMEMKRYGQAIEAFRMVGTARIGKQSRRTVAPGEELYIRVVDPDVGLATRSATLPVRVTTSTGDEEIVPLASLGLGSPVFLGTIKTRLGRPRLTRALDEAYGEAKGDRLEALLKSADELAAEAAALQKKWEEMEQPQVEPEKREAALSAFQSEKDKLAERVKQTRQAADKLRKDAFAELDASYRTIEDILKGWGVTVAEPAPVPAPAKPEEDRKPKPAAEAAESGGEDESAATTARDSLSHVFTQEEIVKTLAAVRAEPTTDKTFAFRKGLLDYWHRQLMEEYKTLDLNGSDTITVEYLDQYGQTESNVKRTDTLGVASDAVVACVGPDYVSVAPAVIFGDQVRVRVEDPDMDMTDEPDTVEVQVASIAKIKRAEQALEAGADGEPAKPSEPRPLDGVLALQPDEEEQMPELVPKDAVSCTLALKETGPHTGVFTGAVATLPAGKDAPEAALKLEPGRAVRIGYADKRSASREGAWVVVAQADIVAGTEGVQEVIELQEGSLDRRSELEKGIALGKLARVYQDLGLGPKAKRAFDEALKVVKKVVEAEGNSPLGEEATYQMWDLYFASGDEAAAADACAKLIATFPDSPLADDALLIMGKAEKKYPHVAIGHFSRLISQYPDSPLAPEAQFLIAETKSKAANFDVAAYEACANKYPDSNFAAKSLLQLSEYYIENRDFDRARDYLERIVLDFPDFDRLDKATFLRGICAYRTGDIQLAYTLMHEIIEKYPDTPLAKSAGKIAGFLAKKIKQ